MARLPITFACGLYDRMLPLYTKEVQAEGIDLNFLTIDSPREIFDRMSGALEFDASEMSSSEFIARFAAGDCPFVALPVFPSRVFRHGYIAVNRKVVRTSADLAGKRIGVPLYTMTAAIFIRGLLQHDCGVDLSQVRWVEGAMNEAKPHGHPTRLALAKAIAIEPAGGRSLSDLIAAGEIAATIGTSLPDAMSRNPDIVQLFPDHHEREKDYYRRTRIFPIMHLVALRREIYEQHPFVATSLYRAFCEAKDLALEKMRYPGTLRYMLPWMRSQIAEIDEVFGGDPWPYGVEANRATLEALVQYLAEQGLIAAPVPVEKLFVPTFGLA
ncbi:MAG TPA: ABC transporter substrate-binding protein [Xanthobacteraceae bacterium]|jgi:4,5-dihydroxyphthalate decarboxylase